MTAERLGPGNRAPVPLAASDSIPDPRLPGGLEVTTVDYHAGGEPFRIVTGGVPAILGSTIGVTRSSSTRPTRSGRASSCGDARAACPAWDDRGANACPQAGGAAHNEEGAA